MTANQENKWKKIVLRSYKWRNRSGIILLLHLISEMLSCLFYCNDSPAGVTVVAQLDPRPPSSSVSTPVAGAGIVGQQGQRQQLAWRMKKKKKKKKKELILYYGNRSVRPTTRNEWQILFFSSSSVFFGSHFDTEKLRSSSSASLSIQGEPEFKWKVKRERPKRIETTTELCLEPNDLL